MCSELWLCLQCVEIRCPPVTVLTLQQKLLLQEVVPAHGAGDQAGTGATVGVVVLPLAVEPGRVGATLHTAHTPAVTCKASCLLFLR